MPFPSFQLEAAGSVLANGTPTFVRGATIARTGAGVYTITLSRALNVADGWLSITLGTTDQTYFLVHTSDTVKTLTIRSAVPADIDGIFEFAAWRIDP